MGWSVRDKGSRLWRTCDAELRAKCEELTKEATEAGYSTTIVASSFVGKVWYAAAHIVCPAGTERYLDGADFTTAYVFLTCGNERGGFGYKDMTETMGPCEVDCPKYILDKLTPVEAMPYAGYAAEWRAACHAKRAEKRGSAMVKPAPGDRIVLPEPISYSGLMLRDFTVVPTPARRRGVIAVRTDYPDAGLYRLPARIMPEWIVRA